jgi:hypothetical protein
MTDRIVWTFNDLRIDAGSVESLDLVDYNGSVRINFKDGSSRRVALPGVQPTVLHEQLCAELAEFHRLSSTKE